MHEVNPQDEQEGVSIIICTHNGAHVVALALEALSVQRYPGLAEILLVDNGSTDGVADLASRYWAKLADPPFPLRRVQESQLGLAFARRTGVMAARYDVIVFCDDDNLLPPDYIARARHGLADQSIGAIGGCCTPTSDVELPPFFYSFAPYYAVGSPQLDSGPVENVRGWLFGAGLAARRRDLLVIYRSPTFPTLTGRAGTLSSASGDDIELCFSLRVMGYQLLYDEHLRFRHHMASTRLDKSYILTLRARNQTEARFLALYRPLVDLSRKAGAWSFCRRLVRFGLSGLRGKYDRAAWFWLLAFLQATWLMTPEQLRLFRHYKWLSAFRMTDTASHKAT